MELGPGNSIGVGLAALLSGADSYMAHDVVKYVNFEDQLPILDELAKLFERRASIPKEEEFPKMETKIGQL